MNPRVLAGIDDQAKTAFPGLRSVLVVRGGELVVERYHHGGTATDYHNVFSVTMSVTSALVGIALGDHRIRSLHQTVGETLLHDPGKWAGVGEPVPLEFIIQIAMCVQVENGKVGMT